MKVRLTYTGYLKFDGIESGAQLDPRLLAEELRFHLFSPPEPRPNSRR